MSKFKKFLGFKEIGFIAIDIHARISQNKHQILISFTFIDQYIETFFIVLTPFLADKSDYS